MELIKRIHEITSKFAWGSFDDVELSTIISKEDVSEKGVSFLFIKKNKFYFRVPEQNWNYNTAMRGGEEGKISQAIDNIAKEYKLYSSQSNYSFKLIYPYYGNDFIADLHPACLVFNSDGAFKSGIKTNKEQDEFLERLVDEVYLKNKAE